MQNKANFRKGQMNVSFFAAKDYENIGACGVQKNKAKQSQFRGSEPVKSVAKKWVFSQRRPICLPCSKTGNRVESYAGKQGELLIHSYIR